MIDAGKLDPLDVADDGDLHAGIVTEGCRLTRVGTLGRRGMILRPATLVFRVPEMAHGSYTLAVFFVGSATGRWANAVPGLWRDSQLGPRLVLRVSH